MLSLVLTVLFVHIAIYLVNTVGATTIDTLVCSLVSRLGVGVGLGLDNTSRNRQLTRALDISYGTST
jgi:hypothetical protein